jgi:serine/threonine protein kinase
MRERLDQSEEPEALPSIDVVLVDCDAPAMVTSTLMSRRDPPIRRRAHASKPPERPVLAAGQVLGGRYRLERRVGSGGMGEVWAAEHVAIHMRVAVKVLLARTLAVLEIVARFEREAVLLGRLQSDHVPRVIDFLVDDVYGPVLVTEFVEGKSLAKVLELPLTVEQVVDLGIDLTTGIAELHHASVVHRDLKPGNVILRPLSDGRTRAVIIDLGVSRLVHEIAGTPDADMVEITTSDNVVGTLEYMAPEQILHCGDVTAAADLYALGALMFRAVTGGNVFGAGMDKMELVRAKLTREAPALATGRRDPVACGLASVVARALESRPVRRYQSAEELRADLYHLRDLTTARPALSDADASPRQAPAPAVSPAVPSVPPSATRDVARRARRRILTAAMFVTLLLGVAFGARIGRGEARISMVQLAPPPQTAVAPAIDPSHGGPGGVQAPICTLPAPASSSVCRGESVPTE